MMNEAQTPLLDLLRGVPADARVIYEHNRTHHQSIPAGWLCADAANEIELLHSALRKANDKAEQFERQWYLAKIDTDRYAFSKTLEGQVVTMETFKVRGASELDQALDDAMAEYGDWRQSS